MQDSDPLWYKDAIIYQLHIKAYFDSNDDGMGDFAGLCEKLDYIADLGVTAIWVLPFYPSPLRDDGYDIADYKNINPAYGSLRDFKLLVREAHKRDLKVITELVINHTSDQHPWFQRARKAKPGSAARNYYVWSDDPTKYDGTRIIFCDTEPSNWTWDPVAGAYYWHRFFHHQPDLNFDNPRVLEEVIKVMKHWLATGVDGLRLDAIPYLCEREGTNNENLPETHDILKKLRTWMNENYPDRMFLGEANQWPEDVLPYFGDGDECHMAFHFPLMPRMYMALAQEDRHPITDIMRQTPDIPDTCQWAIFLRNHDELTLEMVSDRERDYLWQYYAADTRARINMGIRRRLAPLLDNDRRKIELLNSLLMSMPGTPIIYYGDEIGMGDNIFLGDRNGVRTPMQWSPDRNAGFSKSDPQSLFLPPIMDAVYGYEGVNVEAQSRSASSLLNWMKRLITVRKGHQVFGRGLLTFTYPGNRKVLAYLREFEDGSEVILCVANLSRAPQAVELDLRRFEGRIPIELIGRSPFPPIGNLPYFITLPAYGFYWFVLAEETDAPAWHELPQEVMPLLDTLVWSTGWGDLLTRRGGQILTGHIMPKFLPMQRWFAGKDQGVKDCRLVDHADLMGQDEDGYQITFYDVESDDGTVSRYLLPMAIVWEQTSGSAFPLGLQAYGFAQVRRFNKIGMIYDALGGDRFNTRLMSALRAAEEIPTQNGGRLVFRPTELLADYPEKEDHFVRRLGREQSNTSIRIGEDMIFKVFRRIESGVHPELEMNRYLTEVAHYSNVPPMLGSMELIDADGQPAALGILQAFIPNQGDGWTVTLEHLERYLEERALLPLEEQDDTSVIESYRRYLLLAVTMGQRIAQLHLSLAQETEAPHFKPEPATDADQKKWLAKIRKQAEKAMAALIQARHHVDEEVSAQIDDLLAHWDKVVAPIDRGFSDNLTMSKTRIHGDLHLGQLVVIHEDIHILDFEGEPARPLAERRAKNTPLRDVAGMIRSFDYAAWTVRFNLDDLALGGTPESQVAWTDEWQRESVEAFTLAYQDTIGRCCSLPKNQRHFKRLLNLFILEKVLYEICYEASNRPDWLRIPLQGLSKLISGRD
ncbi:maltose alpha-D-glucosyltransferase [Magnetospira sp. QH-2]|uniref:maltose alpha-D-glucosyltransferase n=1 Tax=Magnetospira sp. (strain QH-2) TaxID=1288970 RepID=UPI0003E80DDE|nr:maltose alpha-D-glucosyltransferase [Magnetospira sp. QH-2]CCQ73879.1 GH13 : candidate trehalose synthase [Magnetospira sp. QH-2]